MSSRGNPGALNSRCGLDFRAWLRYSTLCTLLLIAQYPLPLNAETATDLFTAAEILHAFAGDPEKGYNYGDSHRNLFGGLRLETRSNADAVLIYGVQANIAFNLGRSTMDHPAMPAPEKSRYVESRREPAPGPQDRRESMDSLSHSESGHSNALILRTGEIFAGLKQRLPDILGVLGSRARPSVSVALGRSYWRDSFQESLLANVGFFPGLHIIWDSDGYGKATLSPAYLLDGAVSGNNPPGLGSRSQSGILARNSLDSNRYGSSAFYTVGSTWQFGFGVRRHSLRKNARLYHPGVLNYIHFFAGYRGDRLRAGLGFSRVTGELQKARRTRAEKNQDGFEPIPRPGGPRKELSLDISAAELHGTIEWKEDQWSLGFSFFLPESNFEKDGNTDIGYIHPGSPPYLNELSRYFGISSGFQLCNRVRYCSEIKLPSRNLYAKLQLRFKFLWNGYNASLIALYSSARIQRGQGVQNSVPDREAPDYLEWQFRIKKSWDFLRRGSLSINYGRIYIRKTRPSRAFAEYFRIGLDISLYDSTEKDGERYLDKQEENARKAKESLNE